MNNWLHPHPACSRRNGTTNQLNNQAQLKGPDDLHSSGQTMFRITQSIPYSSWHIAISFIDIYTYWYNMIYMNAIHDTTLFHIHMNKLFKYIDTIQDCLLLLHTHWCASTQLAYIWRWNLNTLVDINTYSQLHYSHKHHHAWYTYEDWA